MAAKPIQQHFFIQRGESEGIGQIPTDILHAKSYMELAADTGYTQWKKHRREAKKREDLSGQEVDLKTQLRATDKFLDKAFTGTSLIEQTTERVAALHTGNGEPIRISYPFSYGSEFGSKNFLAVGFAEELQSRLVHSLRKHPKMHDREFVVAVDHRIMQISKCNRTDASEAGRISMQHLFGGDVRTNAIYVLVDDDSEMGSTLANMGHFVVQNGGKVAAFAVPAIMPGGQHLGLREKTNEVLGDKFNMPELERMLARYGITPDTLTNNEGILLWGMAADASKSRDQDTFTALLADAGIKKEDLKIYEVANGSPAQLEKAFLDPPYSLAEIAQRADGELPNRKTDRKR